ncbi:MAG TPA: hypothetical protein VM778_10890, partial [Gemmatimonadota bacterium]|nr:hypothetical protein [Gemmatimonadota bacterium]
AGREVALDPIMATRTGETARMIATHPVPRYEMEMLAAVYFPEPAWPRGYDPMTGENGRPVDVPEWFEERDGREFWQAYTEGRALPAGS